MTFPYQSDQEPSGFWARLRQNVPYTNPVVLAGIITILLFLWVVSGVIFNGEDLSPARPISEQSTENEIFKVQIERFFQENHMRQIELQGRTEADKQVNLAAETAGVIASLPLEKGAKVKKGQIICQIEVGARGAQLEEARALQEARAIEYDAAKKLFEKGHTSKSQVAAAKAAYDAARALTKMRDIELGRTRIRAPFDAIIDRLPLKEGDFIPLGGQCAKIIDKNPLLVVAHVSETEVKDLIVGAQATVTLATGETVIGELKYIAESPNKLTRTFQIEVELANPEDKLRDGVSAQLKIESGQLRATKIQQTVMTLGADGNVGVRVVRDGRVKFVPVEIIANATDGAWVTGLAMEEDIIVVGQDYVREGEMVRTQSDNDESGKSLERFSANE